jgi:spermidine synthase
VQTESPEPPSAQAQTTGPDIGPRQLGVLLISVLVIAVCGLVYELIVGTLSSYLLGSSVTHFSVTIGLFLSAMGLGSYASRWVRKDVLHAFVMVEITVGVVGGCAGALLYAVFAVTDYFYLAMTALIVVIGGCIGMEIPLLTRLSSTRASLRDTLANIFTVDYIGALVGALAFPLLLLPAFGLLRTSFATGLLNLLVAAGIIWAFRRQLRHWHALVFYASCSAVLLVAGLVWSNSLLHAFESRLYRDQVVYSKQTAYQKIVITSRQDDLRLFLNGSLQFSLVDEHRYHESLVLPALALAPRRDNVLILGGGDGMAAREVLRHKDVKRLVLVDIDPDMTRLAREHVALRAANRDALADPRLEVVNADALRYLEEGADLFDAVVIDLPDPNNESLSKLYSKSFYRLLARRLARGAVVASQATSPYFAREAYWSIVHTAGEEAFEVYPYHLYVPSFGDWGFFLASTDPLDLTRYEPRVEPRFLTPPIFAAAQVFDSDVSEVDADISTLDHPAALHYYESGWARWH